MGDGFSWSVSVSGDTAVISAVRDDDNGADYGGLLTEEEGLPLIDAALSIINQILAGYASVVKAAKWADAAEGNRQHTLSEGEIQACYWRVNGLKTGPFLLTFSPLQVESNVETSR